MADTTPAPAPTTALPPKPQPKWVKWATFAAGIILALGGILKLVGTFTLPTCESQVAMDTIRSIYQDQGHRTDQAQRSQDTDQHARGKDLPGLPGNCG